MRGMDNSRRKDFGVLPAFNNVSNEISMHQFEFHCVTLNLNQVRIKNTLNVQRGFSF